LLHLLQAVNLVLVISLDHKGLWMLRTKLWVTTIWTQLVIRSYAWLLRHRLLHALFRLSYLILACITIQTFWVAPLVFWLSECCISSLFRWGILIQQLSFFNRWDLLVSIEHLNVVIRNWIKLIRLVSFIFKLIFNIWLSFIASFRRLLNNKITLDVFFDVVVEFFFHLLFKFCCQLGTFCVLNIKGLHFLK